MRKLLFVALPVGLAFAAAALLLSDFRARSAAEEVRLERARVKREFVERAGLARAIPADRDAEWKAEVAALTRWYHEELQALRERHPGVPLAPAALEAAEAERKGKLAEKDRAIIDDFQRYAEARAALLRDGRYAPVRSILSEGLRLDVVAVEPGASPDGGPGLRVDFALWGAPRLVVRERTGDRTVTRVAVPVAFRRLSLRLLDGGGKLYAEMSGAGEPYQKLVDPERFVEDFPPGVLFGTWWIELLPREAATVELGLEADLRTASGASRPAAFAATLPVAEEWKLPPGAVFQAEIREAAPAP